MKIEDFTPTQNYLLVRPEKKESISKGGIIIPDTIEKPITRGKVIAHNPFKNFYNDRGIFIENKIFEGQYVAFGEFAGHEVSFEDAPGVKFLVIRESSVLGTISNLSIED